MDCKYVVGVIVPRLSRYPQIIRSHLKPHNAQSPHNIISSPSTSTCTYPSNVLDSTRERLDYFLLYRTCSRAYDKHLTSATKQCAKVDLHLTNIMIEYRIWFPQSASLAARRVQPSVGQRQEVQPPNNCPARSVR
jgi:hypothetical protein